MEEVRYPVLKNQRDMKKPSEEGLNIINQQIETNNETKLYTNIIIYFRYTKRFFEKRMYLSLA